MGACYRLKAQSEASEMQNHDEYYLEKSRVCEKNGTIPSELYDKFDVKKGLRDKDNKGVVTGITRISKLNGYETVDGRRVPMEGRLAYRGYDINDLVFRHEGSLRFEECAYLLLFGELPTPAQLEEFRAIVMDNMSVPDDFIEDVIFRRNCGDVMNTLARGVLELEIYDDDINDVSVEHILKQCIRILGTIPMVAAYGYHAHNHFDCNESLVIHRPDMNLSVAENFLRMLRKDASYTPLEAVALDAALTVHMEHGGGNNSAFTTRVITSAGSDTYSVIAGALLSLKGPKHGGANIKVVQMMADLKANVKDVTDREQIREYLTKLLKKEAFDRQGLIYGFGHAVYSMSDPRALILKQFVQKLAREKGLDEELAMYETVEDVASALITEKKHSEFKVCTNVDYYSGFLYNMLGIPSELFTPLFAIARVAGWSAHRIEEIVSSGKIIRPAYVSIADDRTYVPLEKRN